MSEMLIYIRISEHPKNKYLVHCFYDLYFFRTKNNSSAIQGNILLKNL